jgi:acyl-[acyl carrier protein]--UDP-N-acetylglucosamine O-acyltransferase
VKIGIGSVLGGDPQDLKYRGEETRVSRSATTRRCAST